MTALVILKRILAVLNKMGFVGRFWLFKLEDVCICVCGKHGVWRFRGKGRGRLAVNWVSNGQYSTLRRQLRLIYVGEWLDIKFKKMQMNMLIHSPNLIVNHDH